MRVHELMTALGSKDPEATVLLKIDGRSRGVESVSQVETYAWGNRVDIQARPPIPLAQSRPTTTMAQINIMPVVEGLKDSILKSLAEALEKEVRRL